MYLLRILSVACGRLDRLSHGVLWPITIVNDTAKVLCSIVNPSFGFGPYATRHCRENAAWSRVDTSQCSIRPQQQTTIVVYSTYVEVDNISSISTKVSNDCYYVTPLRTCFLAFLAENII